MNSIRYYECRADKRCYSWSACIGRMEIAHLFYLRKENTYNVRLNFKIPYGSIDPTKDKVFAERESAERYIRDEFKRLVNDMGYALGLWKNKI